MKSGLLFLTFLVKSVITRLSNQWMSLSIADVRKVLSVAPSGCDIYSDQVELEENLRKQCMSSLAEGKSAG